MRCHCKHNLHLCVCFFLKVDDLNDVNYLMMLILVSFCFACHSVIVLFFFCCKYSFYFLPCFAGHSIVRATIHMHTMLCLCSNFPWFRFCLCRFIVSFAIYFCQIFFPYKLFAFVVLTFMLIENDWARTRITYANLNLRDYFRQTGW